MPLRHVMAACAAVSLLACASHASGTERRVSLELHNDSDAPILGVSVERTSVFSNKSYGVGQIEMDRPLAPGESRTFHVDIGEHHDTMPYALRWRWTEYGSCQGGADIPGQGDAFSVETGAASCRSGKPVPARRTDGRDALLADAQRTDDIDEARDLYDALLASNPNDTDVLHARAHTLLRESKREFGAHLGDLAITDLEKALRLSSTSSARLHYHRDLMTELLNRKRWQAALPHLDALVAGQPDNLEHLVYRALTHCEAGDLAKATQDERLLEEKAATTLPAEQTCAARRAADKS